MRSPVFLIVFLLFVGALSAETRALYEKNLGVARNDKEVMLIEHVTRSYHNALGRKAKFIPNHFSRHVVPMNYLLNNLCDLEGASHLHIGLDTGMSFVCALYGNESLLSDTVGIDCYETNSSSKLIFDNLRMEFLTSHNYEILVSDCFSLKKTFMKKPVDIYLYDADHSRIAHELAFTHFNDLFAEVFIAVVDDWGWDRVRKGTFNAFDKLGYTILVEKLFLPGPWEGNGLYVAVLRK